jgi:hypothetical protein
VNPLPLAWEVAWYVDLGEGNLTLPLDSSLQEREMPRAANTVLPIADSAVPVLLRGILISTGSGSEPDRRLNILSQRHVERQFRPFRFEQYSLLSRGIFSETIACGTTRVPQTRGRRLIFYSIGTD